MGVYSQGCAGAFGIALQQPLISWGKNIFTAISFPGDLSSTALVVMKVVLRLLITPLVIAVLIIPWAIGQLICRITKPRINYAGLHLVPEFAELPDESEDDSSIDLSLLANNFESLPRPNNMTVQDYICLKGRLRSMLRSLENRDTEICPNDAEQRERFCKEVTLYLRVILKKLQEGDLSETEKAPILGEIAEMSTHCYPTWLEVAARLYSELFGKKGIAENQILSYVQEYKEAILLDLCQTAGDLSWHELTRMRALHGKKLGLNTGRSQYDGYVDASGAIQNHSLLKWVFLQKYQNVSRLVNAVCIMINRDAYNMAIYNFLMRIVTDSNTEVNPVEYVVEHYYTQDSYEIRPEGVVVLLRFLGVIK